MSDNGRPIVTYKHFCGEDHDTSPEVPKHLNPKPPVNLNNIKCKSALEQKSSVTKTYPHKATADPLWLGSWELFFVNTKLDMCPTTRCGVKEKGCVKPYTKGNIWWDGPNKLYGKQNIMGGFIETVCIECENES